jgi:predicted amidohydrolase YtcJ
MNTFPITRRGFAASALALAAAGCSPGRSGLLTTLVFGGPIYTGAGANRVEALLIRDGTIVFAGTLADARAQGPIDIERDLAGAAAFPGFYDSHVHLIGVGMADMRLNLVGVPSIAALQSALARYAEEHTGPVVGRGWIETHWPEKRFPTRADLDAIVNDRPVMLTRIDGHALVANSAMLKLAGIEAGTPDPAGGQILRDSRGEPTGMVIDNAQDLVESKVPAPTRAMKRAAAERGTALYASRGWAGAAHMSGTVEDVELFAALDPWKAPFPIDVYLAPNEADTVFARGPYTAAGFVHVRGIKLYMDGALGSRGAALLAPYNDAPGNGLIVTPPDEYRAYLKRARDAKIQVATHAIGDRGNRLALDAYEATFADDPAALKRARWRIEHAQVVSPEDLPRFAKLGVIASMQPSHAISDLYFAPSRLGVGSPRLAGAYAWKTLLDSGAVVAAGTDAPVEKGDPLIEFYAAAHRHALNGFQGPDWHPEETVSRQQALAMLTSGGAYASFREKERGTLEVGKRASISVCTADLMMAPFAEIAKAQARPFTDA